MSRSFKAAASDYLFTVLSTALVSVITAAILVVWVLDYVDHDVAFRHILLAVAALGATIFGLIRIAAKRRQTETLPEKKTVSKWSKANSFKTKYKKYEQNKTAKAKSNVLLDIPL